MPVWMDRRRGAVMGIYGIDCREENVEACVDGQTEGSSNGYLWYRL